MQFNRSRLLLGESGQEKLKNSSVCIFGIGGVGSYTVEALARSGVGTLTLIDSDKVDVTNINRQIHALHSTVGRYKTEVMRERILDINPSAIVNIHNVFCHAQNTAALIPENCDFVVDAVDNVTAKLAIITAANERGIPVISCMGAANKLDPSAFQVTDIYKTEVCPLCRVMRRELRRRDIKKLTVVYSKEEPVIPLCDKADGVPLGSIAFVPSSAGLLAASHVILFLTGQHS